MTKLKIGNLVARANDSYSDLDQPKLLLNCNDGIATSISPDGHVSKRRVRSKLSRSGIFEDPADSPFVVTLEFSSSSPVRPTMGRLGEGCTGGPQPYPKGGSTMGPGKTAILTSSPDSSTRTKPHLNGTNFDQGAFANPDNRLGTNEPPSVQLHARPTSASS